MKNKTCGHCKKELNINQFDKSRLRKDGLNSWCKRCKKDYYREHKPEPIYKLCEYCKIVEFISINNQKYCSDCSKKAETEQDKKYMKIYRKINKERIQKQNRERSKKYYLIHKERLIKRIREWKNNHPYTLLVDKLRHRINMALKGINKSASTMKLLGCSIEFFKNYYESKFTKGMTWEKVMNGEIHCDHIRPCASFDLNKPSEQRKCFHYINLQPLWAEENRQKGCKF